MPDHHLTPGQKQFLNQAEEEIVKIYHDVLQSIGDFPEEEHDKINKLKRWQVFMDTFPEKAQNRYHELLSEYSLKHGEEATQAIRQRIIHISRKFIQEFEKSLYPAVIIYLCTAAAQSSYL